MDLSHPWYPKTQVGVFTYFPVSFLSFPEGVMLFVRMRKLRAVSLSFSNSLERFRIAARIRSMAVLLRGRVTMAIIEIYHSSQWVALIKHLPHPVRGPHRAASRCNVFVWINLET